MNIKQVIQNDIVKSIEKSGLELVHPVVVGYSTDPKFGDYTSAWPLQSSKIINQSPLEIAKLIQSNIEKNEAYEKPEISEPGFINFRLREDFVGKHLKLVIAEGEKFGSSAEGKGKKVLIEYSSPNIAKPMHVGHLRNTNIGQSLVELAEFVGYETVSDNHLGDWGTQFGKLLWAYKKWGQGMHNPNITELLNLYIRFHQEAPSNPDMEVQAREEFLKLEEGDRENRDLWKKFRESSLIEFDRIYSKLGAKFDTSQGESFYEKDLPQVIDWSLQSGVAKRDPDNSVLIKFEDMPPFLIQKSDRATLYGTRDLATARYRIEKIHPNKIIYVVGVDQTLYFRQLFTALHLLGWDKDVELVHVAYGLTRLPDGKMSTRTGDLVSAADLIEEAEKRAAQVLADKGLSTKDEHLIEQIAIGAIKWNDLKVARESEVTFDWERVFSLEGNTGPYMQYSYARTQNILSKAGPEDTISFDRSLLNTEKEIKIMKHLVRFPELILESAETYYPHVISSYAFELAQEFSSFYEESPVLSSNPELRKARLGLVKAVGITIKTSLRLLGISAPESI